MSTRGEDPVAIQIGFRRALTVGVAVWVAFMPIDLASARYLAAATVGTLLALRLAVLAVVVPILVRMYRSPTPSERMLMAADLTTYSAAAIGVSLMCVLFRGLASPYMPGMCVILLSRTVTAQHPWRRGIVMTGVPLLFFFIVLIGSASLSRSIAAQFSDPAALTMFSINLAYLLGTFLFLVVGGHITWSLRRQIFEARSLGRYRLKRRLASGGMGDVWAAYHPGLKRDVAVKILRPEQQERSATALSRFEREVHATAELVHPNTVRVFDYGSTEDGLWYYVMELLQGETLAEHVFRCGPLEPARALHIVGQAARALGEAHERGIVHRDVKPENLFLTSLGGEHDFVKVLDFGIARIERSDVTMTETGSVLGTPAYISPEVAVGQQADARSDVYGLGAVLYFLLCGRPPFEAESAAALIFAHVHGRVASPAKILGRPLPADVEAVVMKALHKDPSLRYSTGAELALALAGCSLAGAWTFGDAAIVARKSSRPPPSGVLEALPSLAAAPIPSEWAADAAPDEEPAFRKTM